MSTDAHPHAPTAAGAPQTDDGRAPRGSDALGACLVGAFAIAGGMWTLGYFCHLPGLSLPGWVTLILIAAWTVACGAQLGAVAGRGVALQAGLLAGCINLLVLGALLNDPAAADRSRWFWLWIPGSIAACGLTAALGALLRQRDQSAVPNWPLSFALVVAALTLVLLSVGGVVTGFEAGLAVPDWPNSYGYNMFLYPLARMTGGIYYEHAHRLLGSLVGLATLVLAGYLALVERRIWVNLLSGIALAAVVAQGILGGLRVTGRFTTSLDAAELAPNLTLAVVHGSLGQMFFALLICLAVVLSRTWSEPRQLPQSGFGRAGRTLAGACLVLLLLQLIAGALLRHTGATAALHAHLAGSLVVVCLVGWLALRCFSSPLADAPVRALGGAALLMLLGQFALGLGALLATAIEATGHPAPAQVAITTLHQTGGAILLALCAGLMVWHCPAPRARRQRGFEAVGAPQSPARQQLT